MLSTRPALPTITRLCLTAALVLTATSAAAQDSDGDGVADGADVFPCDAAAAGEAFAPARAVHGMILAEDQWPLIADDDFNDFVATYNYAFQLDAAGRVVALRLTMNLLALGGVFDNGLGLHLPIPRGSVSAATLSVDGGPATDLLMSTTDAELTVTLAADVRAHFAGQPNQINSLPGVAPQTGSTLVVQVALHTPTTMLIGEAPYDVFLFRVGNPGHEIHRPEYSGTARMDQSLFGTNDDGSSPGRWFTDASGLPSMLLVPDATAYPKEATSIRTLFPDIAGFAASAGASNADFYLSTVDSAAAYAEPGAPSPAFTTADHFAVNGACLPTGSCQDLLSTGQATTDGTYWIDPDGASGPLAATQVQCDMTSVGGGWTRLTVPLIRDHLTHQFIDYRNNCSVAQWNGDRIHFGETGSCNSMTDVALAVTLPFGYSEFWFSGLQYEDGPSSGSWDVGTENLTQKDWATLSGNSVGDIAFGSRDLARPTVSFTSAGQARYTSCVNCRLTFLADRQVFSLGQVSTDFTIRASEGGGQIEDVYLGHLGEIWVR